MWILMAAALAASPCELLRDGGSLTAAWTAASPTARAELLGLLGAAPHTAACAPWLAVPTPPAPVEPNALQARLLDEDRAALQREFRSPQHPNHAVGIALKAQAVGTRRAARLARTRPGVRAAAGAMLADIGHGSLARALGHDASPSLTPDQVAPWAEPIAARIALPRQALLAATPAEQLASLLATAPTERVTRGLWTRIRTDLDRPEFWFLRGDRVVATTAAPSSFAWLADAVERDASVFEFLALVEEVLPSLPPSLRDAAAFATGPRQLAKMLAAAGSEGPVHLEGLSAAALLWAAQKASHRGDAEAALGIAELADRPDDIARRRLLASIHRQAGATDEALEVLEVPDRITEGTLLLDLTRAALLHQTGRTDLSLLASARERATTRSAVANTAWTLVLHERFDEALTLLGEATTESELHTAATAHAWLGHGDAAFDAMARAHALGPLPDHWFAVSARLAQHLGATPGFAWSQLPPRFDPLDVHWLPLP